MLRGVFFISCHLLDYFSRGLTTRMLFIRGESSIFSDQISTKIVMTLRYFPINLQYVIWIASIENAITFATLDIGPLLFYR